MKLKKLDICIEAGAYDIEAFEMDDGSFSIEVIDSKDFILESHSFEDARKGLEILKRMIRKYEAETEKDL